MAKLLDKLDREVENFSIGLGYGIQNQLEGLYQTVRHPVKTAKGLLDFGQQVVKDPSIAGGLLADTYKRGTSGLLGFGEVLGENLSPGMFRRAPTRAELITYHGSPHRINNVTPDAPYGKFDLEKVGTGEGAQAYGHGIYLAEQPGTARTYQWLAPDEVRIGDERIVGKLGVESRHDPVTIAWNEVTAAFGGQHENPFATAKQRLTGKYGPRNETSAKAIEVINEWQRKGATVQKGGHFYTVDLPDEHIARMLDWDAPLSEQPEAVKEVAAKLGLLNGSKAGIYGDEITGAVVYKELERQLEQGGAKDIVAELMGMVEQGKIDLFGNADQKASEYFRHRYGIPGIKYFDAGSRAAGEGTRNFVIFDPDKVKILKRE